MHNPKKKRPAVKRETASVVVRVYPSTRRRLKVEAAKKGLTIPALIDHLV